MSDGGSRSQLVLGGQRSGKSRWAERRAIDWLAGGEARRATLIATARVDGADGQMTARIARHRADRARAVPGLACLETPDDLPGALASLTAPDHLLIVDCLALWLTEALAPIDAAAVAVSPAARVAREQSLIEAIGRRRGPMVIVSNEVGLGIVPLGALTRDFVDALGWLNQAVAAACDDVVLMVAGQPLPVKGRAA